MRFLPTRIHGILDWLLGVLLIALPWVLHLERSTPEGCLPLVLGLTGLVVTGFTDYELGLVRRIPMSLHVWVDGIAGALLAASPWLFGFADRIYLPHLILGLMEVSVAFVSELRPRDRPARQRA